MRGPSVETLLAFHAALPPFRQLVELGLAHPEQRNKVAVREVAVEAGGVEGGGQEA